MKMPRDLMVFRRRIVASAHALSSFASPRAWPRLLFHLPMLT